MIKSAPTDKREFRRLDMTADLVVAGGGLAGLCCALTAARAGARVILVQDRPVLGGNASSEVRLWALGAVAHRSNSNRWAREGGVIGEILVENLWRNPEGNPVLFDALLHEKADEEPNLTLLLNTALIDVDKRDPERIRRVRAFCSQNSTLYDLQADLFCDATGDGALGFLSGAAFRMGAEARDEFGESVAPSKEFGELLGHSIYFYSKDLGKPVRFQAPAFALKDITRIPRYRSFSAKEHGCRLWWIEYGGRLDTVHQAEEIKWELWRIVYGVWDHIKNSGNFPDAETLTLEWVGLIAGKRESRRFEGPYMLRQSDVLEPSCHFDAVAHGGWSIDLHPADGVYSPLAGAHHWQPAAAYAIPYRCLFSRNIRNLFLSGRAISTSHVAFASTRVMLTCAVNGQAAGMAAAQCVRGGLEPADLTEPSRMLELQRDLIRAGQHIPGVELEDPDNLAALASFSASSRFVLGEFAEDGDSTDLEKDRAMLLPLAEGPLPRVSFLVEAEEDGELCLEAAHSPVPGRYTPDRIVASTKVRVKAGKPQWVALQPEASLDRAQYVFFILRRAPKIKVRTSGALLTGVASLYKKWGSAHSPTERSEGLDYETFVPERRPKNKNLALRVEPALDLFGPENSSRGRSRPGSGSNAWVADPEDPLPTLKIQWPAPTVLKSLHLAFDTDYDHPMETVFMGHPERAMPFCVRHYRMRDGEDGRILHEEKDNHSSSNAIALEPPWRGSVLTLELLESHGLAPRALFGVRAYGEKS